jgi:hypothetical protein
MAPLSLAMTVRRVRWHACQIGQAVYRRFGLVWVGVGVSCLLAVVLMPLLSMQMQQIADLKRDNAVAKEVHVAAPTAQANLAGDLNKFEQFLPEYEDFSQVLRDLIVLAQNNDLSLLRGEYQTQVDERGKFLRNQMTLPVRGTAPAVERFILEALVQNRTLALESVQFKREGGAMREVEVKIQWVFLTGLPSNTSAKP